MKVKTKTLSSFLKKVRMSGAQSISEGVLRFEKEGLKFSANSDAQQARVMGWLKTGAFTEYEELGNVGLNDLENVVKVLDRFDDDISITKEGNLLTVKSKGKKVEIELVNENFLNTDTNEPNLEFQETFDITASKLHDIIKDVKMNKDATLTIKTAAKAVLFTNTGKYKFANTIEAETCKGELMCSFGSPFTDAVENLDGPLQISVGPNYPCKIIEKVETSIVTFIVAPIVENEE